MSDGVVNALFGSIRFSWVKLCQSPIFSLGFFFSQKTVFPSKKGGEERWGGFGCNVCFMGDRLGDG